MDDKQKAKHEKMFQGCDFSFSFQKCQKMAEMIRSYCTGETGWGDCCSIMKKMMRCGKGEEATDSGTKP